MINTKRNINSLYSWMKTLANKLGLRGNMGSRGEAPEYVFATTPPSESRKIVENAFLYVNIIGQRSV